MAALAEQSSKRWTYEEYARLDDEQRDEIIDGELLMAPEPDTWHQDWSKKLFRRIDRHVMDRELGEVFFAPVDVILDAENVVQSDLLFIAKANLSILQKRGVFGAPDLLVELISPSSMQRDRFLKKSLYLRFGVKEYWIVDIDSKALEIWKLQNRRYELHCEVEQNGGVTSPLLPGLAFDLSEIAGS